MDENRLNKVSHLFLVRLWLDQEGSEGSPEGTEGTVEAQSCYGKVQHVVTGRAGTFSSQGSMAQLLATMLSLSGPGLASGMQGEQPGSSASATQPHALDPQVIRHSMADTTGV